jgi:hypothetical protein
MTNLFPLNTFEILNQQKLQNFIIIFDLVGKSIILQVNTNNTYYTHIYLTTISLWQITKFTLYYNNRSCAMHECMLHTLLLSTLQRRRSGVQ